MSRICATQGRGFPSDSRIRHWFGRLWWIHISSLPCVVVRLFLCASVHPSRSHSPGHLQWLAGEVWGGWGDRGRPQSQWQLQECRGRKQQGREVANRQEPHALRHLEAKQVSDSKRGKSPRYRLNDHMLTQVLNTRHIISQGTPWARAPPTVNSFLSWKCCWIIKLTHSQPRSCLVKKMKEVTCIQSHVLTQISP